MHIYIYTYAHTRRCVRASASLENPSLHVLGGSWPVRRRAMRNSNRVLARCNSMKRGNRACNSS